ncbi:hypothetical protein NMG60_11005444 [Bertholletia excelsa]
MSSICISNCVDDVRVPNRSTYVNLHKWPEFEPSSLKTVAASSRAGRLNHPEVVVADGVPCRQLYLRSHTFFQREMMPKRTRKCLEWVQEVRRKRKVLAVRRRRRRCVVVRRVRELSCAALCAIFHRLLACTTSVDVVENREL